jgi:hypothetical protein
LSVGRAALSLFHIFEGTDMVIQKNKLTLGVSIIAAAATVAADFWLQHRPVGRVASLTPPISSTHREVSWNKTREANDASSVQVKAASTTQAPKSSIRQRMRTAKDWYALAKEILPQARAGDPEAQYVLFQTFRDCFDTSGLERVQFPGNAVDNLNAVRELANQHGLSDSFVSHFQQCHGFNTDDAASLGDPWDWLQKATDAGYAPAQATTAQERLMQDQSKASVRAGAHPTDPAAYRTPIGGDASPRDLLVAAVQSDDPDVLGAIANLLRLLNPTQPLEVTKVNSIAWQFVACQRGTFCSDLGSATVTNCGPNDGQCVPVPDMFLSQVNNNWAPVQERVNQINAALAAKQWNKLPGLAPGG